jgi:probable HAF family extracellular repeat protein
MMTRTPLRRVTLFIAMLCLTALSQIAQTQPLQDLGTLGGNNSRASGINASGQIVGHSNTATGDTHAFLYLTAPAYGFPAGMNDLGTFGGEFNGLTFSIANAINSQGQIVGSSLVPMPEFDAEHAFLWTPGGTNGVPGNAQMVDLGTLGGTSSAASGINAYGQVVGYSQTAGDAEVHPFLWQPDTPNGTTGTMIDLGTLGGIQTGQNGFNTNFSINDRGQIVGETMAAKGERHAFLWTPDAPNGTTGTMVDLGTVGGFPASVATSINASGQVAGRLFDPSTGLSVAFLWQPNTPNGTIGTMISLGTIGGIASGAGGINSSGKVVGFSFPPGNAEVDAVLWTPTTPNGTTGTFTNLGTLGGVIADATGINDADQIVGFSYVTGNGASRAFLYQKMNAAPVAADQTKATNEDTPTFVTLSATDADGDTLTYQVVSPPSHGNLIGTAPYLVYIPDRDYHGPDSFTFLANDGKADSNVATVSLDVGPTNDAPHAFGISYLVNEDAAIWLGLPAGDPDGDALTYEIVSGPTHGTLSGAGASQFYTPDPNFNGTDSFTFRVYDGQAYSGVATVTLMVSSLNDPPVAVNDTATTKKNKAVTISVLDNDSDPDGGTLTVQSVTQPTSGTVVKNANNTLTFTPRNGFTGTVTFTYVLSDGQGGTATATVTINVTK